MNLILIAPPAAGKGTFASRLTKEFGLVSISAGELLRNIDPETELGKQVRQLQAKRELVPDELINGLIKERLSKVKPVERNLKGWLKQYQKLATSADKGAILK